MATQKNKKNNVRVNGEWSLGRKTLAVFLSLAMLGLGWPAVSLAQDGQETQDEQLAKIEEAATTGETVEAELEAPATEVATETIATQQDAIESTTVATSSENVYVNFVFNDGYIIYGDTKVGSPANGVWVSNTTDPMEFAVVANSGYSVKEVKSTVEGAEATLSTTGNDSDGNALYQISNKDVLAGATVEIVTEKAATSSDAATTTDPEAEAIDKDTVIEPSQEATDDAATDEPDATDSSDEATEDKSATEEKEEGGSLLDSIGDFFGGLFGGNATEEASTEDGIATTATDYNIFVGDSQTITGTSMYYAGTRTYQAYNHEWTISNANVATIAGSNNKATVKGVSAGTVTVTHTFEYGDWWNSNTASETWTVFVDSKVKPTSLSINGPDSIEEFESTTLKAVFEPEGASSEVSWFVSDETKYIARVDESTGELVGMRAGLVEVHAICASANGEILEATKIIEVTRSTKVDSNAQFYYFIQPGGSGYTNSSDAWSEMLGIGTVNLSNGIWYDADGNETGSSGKNVFDAAEERVLSWPSGLGDVADDGSNEMILTRGSKHWNEIFKIYRSYYAKELNISEDQITEDNIDEIRLAPVKISVNNGTTPDPHVDCLVKVSFKNYSTITYDVKYPNDNNYSLWKSKMVQGGTTLEYETPGATKTVNGQTYTFLGWYTNPDCNGATVDFPYTTTPNKNVTFYGKYVRSDLAYTINYYRNGTTTQVRPSDKISGKTAGDIITAPELTGFSVAGFKFAIADETTKEINFYYYENVTLVANSAEVTYNGQEQSATGYTVLWPDDGTAAPTFEGVEQYMTSTPGKDANLYLGANAFTLDNDIEIPAILGAMKVSTDGQYLVTNVENGDLTILPKSISVITESAEKIYDGTPLTKDAATVVGIVEGETYGIHATGSQTAVGESFNGYEITWAGDNTYTAKETNYQVDIEKDLLGTLTVKDVTINAEDVVIEGGTFTYDGQAHGATVKLPELPTGYYWGKIIESESYSTASATHVAETQNSPVKATLDNLRLYRTDVLDGIEIPADVTEDVCPWLTEKSAEIKIIPAKLTVFTPDASKAWDGKALTAEGIIGNFQNDETATFKTTGTQTEVGSSPNFYAIEWTGTARQSDYDIDETIGTLTVTKNANEIVVNVEKLSVTYDGEEHTPLVTITGLPDGYDYIAASDVVESNVTSGQKEAKVADYTIFDENNNDVTANFGNVVVNNGYLEIKKKPVTVTTKTDAKVYDGLPLTAGYTVEGLIEGEAPFVTITTTGEAKDVTDKAVINDYTIDWGVIDKNNYDVASILGTLSITPRPVTLTSDNLSKSYDGTALTNGDTAVIVGESGFVEGEGATYDFTGSQTLVGSSANKFSYTLNDNTKEGNYIIAKSEGTLTVTDRAADELFPLTVKGNSETVTYDGKAHSVTGVDISEATFNGVTFKVVTTTAGATDKVNAGTYANEITSVKVLDGEGNDVTKQFNIDKQNGNLTINKAKVTLTSASDTKEYDGTELVKHEVSAEGFVAGEGASYTFTGSRTTPGTSENVFSYTLNEGTSADNYEITEVFGNLTVTDRATKFEFPVTAVSTNVTYDGQRHAATGLEAETTVINGKTFTITGLTTSNPSQFDAGAYDNTISNIENAKVLDENKQDVTAQFEVKATNGKLVITPAQVTLKSASLTKAYDGTALENGETALEVESGFVAGEGATYEFTSSQTVVGSTSNEFKYTLNSNTNASNYNITVEYGTLTVTNAESQFEVTVKANSETYDFDGTEKSVSGVEGDYKFTLDNGAEYTIEGLSTEDPKATNAGTYTNNITGTAVVKDAQGNDVTDQFTVSTENGSLTINKVAASITTGSGEKAYDGKALTNGELTNTGFVGNNFDGKSWAAEGSQTTVGSSVNGLRFDGQLYTANTTIETTNYTITVTLGTLEVTPMTDEVTVTVQENSDSVKYDGGEKSVNGYTVKSIQIAGEDTELYTANDFTFTASDGQAATGTDAGTYDVNIKASDFANTSANFENVKFVILDGTLTITPREVMLTSASATKEYDGSALTRSEQSDVTVTGDGFVESEGATYAITGTQTEVGESDNAFTYALNENTKSSNYEISKVVGKLNVTKNSNTKVTVTITEHSGNVKYSGAEQSVKGYDVAISGVDAGLYTTADFTFSGDATATGKDAGSYDMNLLQSDFANVSSHYANVEFVIVDGTLTIEKRDVTITSASAEKTYDGTALVKHEASVTGEGFVEGEGTSYEFSGTQTAPGTSENYFSYKLNAGTNADNYNITTQNGTLTVTNRTAKYAVTITAASDSATYDGESHSASGFEGTVTDDGIEVIAENGQTYYVSGYTTSNPSGVNAGTYANEITGTPKVVDADGNDVTSEFAVTPQNGTLTIAKRDVTISSETDSKVYDGSALTAPEVTSEDAVFNSEVSDLKATGTVTNVSEGEVTNTIEYTPSAKFDINNYNLTKNEGKLSITPVTDAVVVTITENGATYTYDATEKTVEGYSAVADNTLYNVNTGFTFSGNDKVTRTNAGAYDMELVPANFTNVDKNFSNVTFEVVDGQLVINQIAITIQPDPDFKVYDGTTLKPSKFSVIGDVVTGQTVNAVLAGEIGPNVGYVENASSIESFTITDAAGVDVSANYNVTTKTSWLSINPVMNEVVVTIVGNSDSTTYDATEHSVNGYTVTSISNPLYTTNDFTVEGASATGTNAGSYQTSITASNNSSTNFTDVRFEITQGQLTIAKRLVTITSASAEKPYDGTALTNDEVTTDGFATVGGVEQNDGITWSATGSQTVKGSSANTLTINGEVRSDGVTFETENYVVTPKVGTLKVTDATAPLTATITAASGSTTYDGNTHTVSGWAEGTNVDATGAIIIEVNGNTYKVTGLSATGASEKNAGSYENKVEGNYTVTDADGNDVTDQFNIETVNGSLDIAKRNVTFTSASDEKAFDGTALTNGNVEVSGDGFVAGEDADFTVTGTQTAVGTSDNTFTYALKSGTLEGNYNITTEVGKLTVNAQSEEVIVYISGESKTVVYNGETQYATGFEITGISNPAYLASYVQGPFGTSTAQQTSGRNVGTYTMALSESDFTNKASANFTNVKFVVTPGVLTITPATATVTAQDATKVFGEADPTFSATVTGLQGSDAASLISYTVARSGNDEAVGTYENVIGATGEAVQGNYNVVYVPATFTITAQSITPDPDPDNPDPDNPDPSYKGVTVSDPENVTYDGTAHKWTPEVKDADGNALVEGVDYEVEYKTEFTGDGGSSEFTDVETVTVVIKGKGNYSGEIEKTYSITPRTVTVTSVDLSKVYDGTALVNGNNDLVVTGDGWAGEEGIVPTFTGEQTLVGSSENSFSYVTKANTKLSNYAFAAAFGTLTVKDSDNGTDVDPAKVITKTHEAKEYKLGDTVEFTISATNIYAEAQTMTFSEQAGVEITGDATFDNVAPGATVTTTAEYTITEDDILAGSFTNTATVTFENGKSFDGKDTIGADGSGTIEDANGHLAVTKDTTSTPANGSSYALGEKITYRVTVTNDGNLTITDVKVTDELDGATLVAGQSEEVGELAPGEVATVDYEYTVTEADVIAGKVANSATASGTSPDPNKPDPGVTPGDKDVPTDTADASLFVEKTADKTSGANAGDVINYTIKVTNNGNVTVSGIIVEDELTGATGDNALTTNLSLAPGESREFTTSYTVTEDDVLAGSVENVATAKGTSSDNKDVDTDGKVTTDTVGKIASFTVAKERTNSPENGEAFKLGEKITYSVTITNNGNLTLTNIKVTDQLDGATLTSDSDTVESLAPGASASVNYEYTVTEADVLAGSVANTATAEGSSPDPDKPTVDPENPGTDNTDTEDAAGHLTVTKTVTSTAKAADGKYALGEKIEYKIVATNDGNLTIEGAIVTDDLTGEQWTIATLAPGESREFTTSHEVTEADMAAGSVVNNATATGNTKDPETPQVPVTPGKTDTPVENLDANVSIEKTVTNTGTGANGAFALGDEIEYQIGVKNTGNVTLKDVKVVDELIGIDETIGELAIGGEQTFTGKHAVTQDDIIATQVVNTATASASALADESKTTSAQDTVTTGDNGDGGTIVDPKAHLTVVKETTSTPANGTGYARGEQIDYKITVTNDGNLDVTDVFVVDQLTGLSQNVGDLAVGQSAEVTTSYTVTEADVLAGNVANVATARGTSPDPNTPVDPTPGTKDEKTDTPNGHMTVTKTVVNSGAGTGEGGAWAAGDVINYRITVTNDGNLDLTNVVVTDALTGASWTVGNLAAGATSEVLETSYTVTEADTVAGSVLNEATATGTSSDGTPGVTPGRVTETTEVATNNVTITKTTTSQPQSGTAYRLGETITYEITATNNGNLTVENFVITDELTGDTFTIASLAPGETSETFTVSYVVTAADVTAGSVVNVATGEGTIPADPSNGPTVTPGEEPNNTEPTPVVPPVVPGTIPDGPLAPVIDGLQDAITPLVNLVEPQEETIADEATPLAAGDANCWVHYYIYIGIFLTLVYGAGVVTRRALFGRKLKDFEDDTMGKTGEESGEKAWSPAAQGASNVTMAKEA